MFALGDILKKKEEKKVDEPIPPLELRGNRSSIYILKMSANMVTIASNSFYCVESLDIFDQWKPREQRKLCLLHSPIVAFHFFEPRCFAASMVQLLQSVFY